MAKRIKDIVDRINRRLGKFETGYFNPTEIVDEVHTESINLFRYFHQQYSNTRRISEHLEPFIKSASKANGDALPDDYHNSLPSMTDGNIAVDHVDLMEWVNRYNHPNKKPSASYPIMKIEAGKIYVLPASITVVFKYFKTPTKPVYATTVSNNRLVYNDGGSSDYEWSIQVDDLIVNRVLQNKGISIKDSDIIEYAQLEKSQETE